MHVCDNCGAKYADENQILDEGGWIFPDIPDLVSRVEAGGVVPSGACGVCSALVYIGTSLEMSVVTTVKATVRSAHKTNYLISMLVPMSVWFEVTPLPDDLWEVRVKDELGNPASTLIRATGTYNA